MTVLYFTQKTTNKAGIQITTHNQVVLGSSPSGPTTNYRTAL